MKVHTLRKLRSLANTYFENSVNRPFSVLEICNIMKISIDTLKSWQNGDEEEYRLFASSIISRVGESWEKGELSPSLATTLIKQYLEDTITTTNERDFTIRIVENGI